MALHHRFALILLAAGLGLAACDASSADGSARVRVLLTDAPFPFDLADSANVTIERVELVTRDSARIVLSDSVFWFNLLDLRDGVTAELADSVLLGGTYAQLRFIVGDSASVVFHDGRVFPLRVPSGTQTGIKVNLPPIEVENPGETVVITADFDVERSFNAQGPPDNPTGFHFRPVLHLDSLIVNGQPVPREEFPEGDGE